MEKEVENIIARYKQGRKEDLIPLLQEIQEEAGYISEEAVICVGRKLNISTTKIFGLATFYDQFRFFPLGKVHFRVCHGTSCYMNGSGSVLAALKDELGVECGQTTRDGKFSYEVVNCMGSCSNGPVVQAGDDFFISVSAEQIQEMIKKLRFIVENE